MTLIITINKSLYEPYFIVKRVHFFIENDAEILHVHFTWEIAFTNLIHKQSIQVQL
jgi:hypothetical protein